MKDRLQRFLDAEELTPAKLADILNVQRSGLSHILSGRNKPGFDFINKLITNYPTLNPDWLITGKGNIYRDEREQPKVEVKAPEISIKPIRTAYDNKKPILKKILLIYSDNTFEEIKSIENLKLDE